MPPRALFKTGYFQDIQLGRDGDVLVVTSGGTTIDQQDRY